MIIVGNIIMFIASLIMVSLGLFKTCKQVVTGQTVQIGLMGIGSIFLGTIPGLIANILGIVRNLLSYHSKLTRALQVTLSIAAAIAILLFNNIGWLGLLPLLAAVIYTLCMNTADIIKLKCLIGGTLLLWAVHDFAIQSYVSFAFDIFSILTCIIGIVREYQTKSKTYVTISKTNLDRD